MLERLRDHLAHADALLPISLVGLACGLVTGAVIIALRALTESSLPALGLLSDPEGYESLSAPLRIALPVVGALVIGVLFQAASVGSRQVGVLHVMERLAYHSGRMPWKNAVLQFFGAALSIISGHSVGREGPVIHVGAASSSLLGQWFNLPNNSIRVLVACGTAASIAASFNTPIAGVIFAMEVVMMEYTLVGFTPVILAAVSATSLSRAVYGAAPAFDVPAMQMQSWWELVYILGVGMIMGALAALFIHTIQATDRRCRHLPLWIRTTAAGAIVAGCALVAPEIMGIGYDTVQASLLGELALHALLVIVLLKVVATAACVSLGLPGGLIGPTLVIGAVGGAALGTIGDLATPGLEVSPGLYALLGMGAMMGATLQAPLAALMAILELTANPNIILPGMFAIVTASLTSRVVFKKDSVFVTMLRERGLEYTNDPVAVALASTGVGAVMSYHHQVTDRSLSRDQARAVMSREPDWVLACDDRRIVAVVRRERLEAALGGPEAEESRPLDLGEASIAEPGFVTVRLHATLREALEALDREDSHIVLVTKTTVAMRDGVFGVLTRDQIESGVRFLR